MCREGQAVRKREVAPCESPVFTQQTFSEQLICAKHEDVKLRKQT